MCNTFFRGTFLACWAGLALSGAALACFIALALSGHEVAAQEKRGEGRDALPNAKSLSGEERQRTIRELRKKDFKELEAHVPFLLDVFALDLFGSKWRYNPEEIGKLRVRRASVLAHRSWFC